MQFDRVKDLVTSKDVQLIMASLEKFGILVQGCWVVRRLHFFSVFTFKHKQKQHDFSFSEINYSGRAVHCRDYLLSMFAKDRFVMRKEFSDVAMLTPEIVRDILSEISKLKVGKGWEFKLPTDINFIKA
jgi:DNA-directed RNA polymerase-3 subunit RPC5